MFRVTTLIPVGKILQAKHRSSVKATYVRRKPTSVDLIIEDQVSGLFSIMNTAACVFPDTMVGMTMRQQREDLEFRGREVADR